MLRSHRLISPLLTTFFLEVYRGPSLKAFAYANWDTAIFCLLPVKPPLVTKCFQPRCPRLSGNCLACTNYSISSYRNNWPSKLNSFYGYQYLFLLSALLIVETWNIWTTLITHWFCTKLPIVCQNWNPRLWSFEPMPSLFSAFYSVHSLILSKGLSEWSQHVKRPMQGVNISEFIRP